MQGAKKEKSQNYIVLEELVKQKNNLSSRVKYYMNELPDEKSLAFQKLQGP